MHIEYRFVIYFLSDNKSYNNLYTNIPSILPNNVTL